MTRRDQIIRLAEQVMGWHIQPPEPEPKDTRTIAWWDKVDLTCREYIKGRCIRTRGFDPYTSLTDAWMLVEAIQARGCTVTITCAPEPINRWRRCAAQIRKEIRNRNEFTFARDGDTAPDAICAAALRFVELMEESNA